MSSSSESAAPLLRLVAKAPDESTLIEVLDGDLHSIPLSPNLGEISVDLPAGVYSVRFQRGNVSRSKTVVLSAGSPVPPVTMSEEEAPRFATAAPVRKTSSTRELHRIPAQRLSHSQPLPPPAGQLGGSRLLVFARDLHQGRSGDPASGITLHDLAGKLLFDFGVIGERDVAAGWAGAHVELRPGPYRLRSQARAESSRSRFSEQVIHACQGWQTQVFLLAREGDVDDQRRGYLANLSLLMARPEAGFDFEREDLRWTEVALRALEKRESVPGTLRTDMLWAKFDNPMLGIYAALLHLRRQEIDRQLMRDVVFALKDLVGALPDVLAIGWGALGRDQRLADDGELLGLLKQPQQLATPPMLRESWSHLVEATVREPDLIPAASLTDRVAGQIRGGGAWLVWRGEPAPVERTMVMAAPEALVQARIASGGLQTGLTQLLSNATLWLTLPILQKFLAVTPDAAHVLSSQRFTDLERRIARYVYPLADPALCAFFSTDGETEIGALATALPGAAGETSSATSPLTKEDLAGDTDVRRLLAAIGVPAGSALRAVGSLAMKLTSPPIPNDWMVKAFVDRECRGLDAYRDLLLGLGKIETPLHHRRSSRAVSALQLLSLVYRRRASSASDWAGFTVLATKLDEADYVWSVDPNRTTGDQLSRWVDDVRAKLIASLSELVQRGELTLGEGWVQRVLPAPGTHHPGTLLPPLPPPPAAMEPTRPIAGKSVIVEHVADKVDGISKEQARQVFESMIQAIVMHLQQGERVQVAGLGSFSIGDRAARSGRNPKTGELIKIETSKTVRFKAGKDLKDAVNG